LLESNFKKRIKLKKIFKHPFIQKFDTDKFKRWNSDSPKLTPNFTDNYKNLNKSLSATISSTDLIYLQDIDEEELTNKPEIKTEVEAENTEKQTDTEEIKFETNENEKEEIAQTEILKKIGAKTRPHHFRTFKSIDITLDQFQIDNIRLELPAQQSATPMNKRKYTIDENDPFRNEENLYRTADINEENDFDVNLLDTLNTLKIRSDFRHLTESGVDNLVGFSRIEPQNASARTSKFRKPKNFDKLIQRLTNW
jgi:hypothetical protein